MDESITKIHALILEDHHWTIDELVDLIDVSWKRGQKELQQNRSLTCTRIIKRQSQMNVCQELKEELNIDPNLILKVITDDKSWCYNNYSEIKQHSSQGQHPMSPLPEKSTSNEVQHQDDIDLLLWHERNCLKNIFLLVKLLTRLFNWKFRRICKMQWDRNAPSCDNVKSGVFIMTMRQCEHFECETFSQEKLNDPTYPPSTFTWSCSLWKKVLKRTFLQM